MDDLLALFVTIGGLALLITALSLWSRRRLRTKLLALFLAALFLPASYISLVALMGRPKPFTLEISHKALTEAEVLSAQMKEDEAIYLWLRLPEVEEPRAYRLAWSENLARQLHEAMKSGEASGNQVMMRNPFQGDLPSTTEPVFHAPPPTAQPTKQQQAGRVQTFVPQAQASEQ
ncbi:MAG: hypothetical protein ACREDZ_11580 [Kiloniellales bacterium]